MVEEKKIRGPLLTPAHCRAARSLLDWKQEVLAEKAQVSVNAVRNFEKGHTQPVRGTLRAIQHAFEEEGVRFINRTYADERSESGYMEAIGVRMEKPFYPLAEEADVPFPPDHKPMTLEEVRAAFTDQFDLLSEKIDSLIEKKKPE